MEVKNISERTYLTKSCTIHAGAVVTVPDSIGKFLLKSGEFEEIIQPKVEEPKKEVKKSVNTRKSNNRRV